MSSKLFEDLRSAFATDPRAWAKAMGLAVKGAGTQTVLNCVCPFCEADKKKSDIKARFALWCDKGNAFCKGCQFKTSDIVDTFKGIRGISGDHAMTDAAHQLADLMKVRYEKFDPAKIKDWHVKLPATMTDKVIGQGAVKLIDVELFAPLRKWIREEWGVTPQQAVEQNVIAWQSGTKLALLYPCWDEKTGKLVGRYRVQLFALQDGKFVKAPRRWSRGEGRCPDLWPRVPDHYDTYLIVEGESDRVVASSLFGHEAGVIALTKGKSARLQREHFPPAMVGKRVIICQDLDAFRGPKDRIEGGTHGQREKIWSHTTKTLRAMALYFQERNCEVMLARIPLDPVVHPKGDLRDWVKAGGRELGELELFSYEDVYRDYDKIVECETIDQVYDLPSGTRLAVTGKAISIAEETVTLTNRTRISCDMLAACMGDVCERCWAPRLFGDKMIRWEEFEEEQTFAALQRPGSRDNYVVKSLIRKPSKCSSLRLENSSEEVKRTYRFELGRMEGTNEQGPKIQVLSKEMPTAVGNIRVIGRGYVSDGSFVIRAEAIEELDANTWNPQDELLHDGLQKTPHGSNDIEVINRFCDEIAQCVGDHVTSVYGQNRLQLGVLLGLCSSLYFFRRGRMVPTRGFMDVGIIGVTRSGKSQTLKGFITSERWGILTHSGIKLSVAGLTISNHKGIMRPGTLPRFHGRAVVLDEFQTHLKRGIGGYNNYILDSMQGARSDGRVNSNQMTGDFSLDAAVRLFIMANPPNSRGSPDIYGKYLCRHFKDLYRSDECLARMDYPIWVTRPEVKEPAGVPNKYPRKLVEYIISRAWAQEASDVILTDGVEALATKIAEEWASTYDERLPLYTGGEKEESLLRVAIAIANLTLSHPSDDYRKVEVRPVHVKWAAQWMDECWRSVGYDLYSERLRGAEKLPEPIKAVSALLAPEAMATPAGAAFLLEELSSPMDLRDVRHLAPGDTYQDQLTWMSAVTQKGIFRVFNGEWAPTESGRRLLENLVQIAEQDPELYTKHRTRCCRVATRNENVFGQEDVSDISDPEEWELFRRDHNL